MPPAPPTFVTDAITAVVVGLVMAFRWRRMGRPVLLKPGRLWIVPAIHALAVIALYARFPPTGWG